MRFICLFFTKQLQFWQNCKKNHYCPAMALSAQKQKVTIFIGVFYSTYWDIYLWQCKTFSLELSVHQQSQKMKLNFKGNCTVHTFNTDNKGLFCGYSFILCTKLYIARTINIWKSHLGRQKMGHGFWQISWNWNIKQNRNLDFNPEFSS